VNIEQCQSCNKQVSNYRTAVVNGTYYKVICARCLGDTHDDISSNAAGFERRRGYEDNAQDTIQPYDANGQPRSEFARLYPDTAKKVFTDDELQQVKRKI
jgi:hypothetical protein